MKKLLLLGLFMLTSLTLFSQVVEQEKSSLNPYFAMGVSITNADDFSSTAYPSIEVGVMKENVALGVVVGRFNFNNIFSSRDQLSDYYYQGKVAVYQNVGAVDLFALGGIGTYFNTRGVFVEYGLGISKEFKGFSLFLQASSFDGVNFVTPGISFSL